MENIDSTQNQPQNQNQDQGQIQTQQNKPAPTQPTDSQSSGNKLAKFLPFIIIILVVGVGILTGLVLSAFTKSQTTSGQVLSSEEELSPELKENLTQTFRDEAEGTIEKNDDLDKYAQGTHKLIRPGGEDQTAYLTSSVLDLDEYVGKKIKVYGETFGSSQVGWLMDVGKVEVLE